MRIFILIVLLGLFSTMAFAQEVDADDRVNITQVSKPFIGVYAFGYQGSPNPGYPQFQLNNYGGVPGSVAATADNSILGMFQFSGHDGSAKKTVGVIRVRSMDNFATNLTSRMDFQIGPQRQLRMTILGDNGYIGMGTDTPESNLHVDSETGSANAKITSVDGSSLLLRAGTNDNDALEVAKYGAGNVLLQDAVPLANTSMIATGSASTSGLILGTRSSNPTYLMTDGAMRMMVDDDGQIGVNTTSPNARLHIETDDSSTEFGIRSEVNYSGSFDVRAIYGSSVTNPGFGYGGQFIGGYRGSYSLAQGSTYTGTSIGAYNISTGTAGSRRGAYNFGNNPGGNNAYGSYDEGRDAINNYGSYNTASGGSVAYGTYSSAGGAVTNWASYMDTGNNYMKDSLFIGSNTNQRARLDVSGTSYFDDNVTLNGANAYFNMIDATTNDGIRIASESGGGIIQVREFPTDDILSVWNTSTERFGIRQEPNYTLDVLFPTGIPSATAGNGLNLRNAAGGDDSHWTLYVYSSNNLNLFHDGNNIGSFNATTGNYTALSDRTKKKNIEELESQMEKIMQLKPSTYIFKHDKENAIQYGLISQEVMEVYPEMVNKMTNAADGDTEELYGIEYATFVPVLIAGLQEHQVVIEEKEEEIEELKQRNEDLVADNANLNDKVNELTQEMEQVKQMLAGLNDRFNQVEEDMSQCCMEELNGKVGMSSTTLELEDDGQEAFLEQNAPNPFHAETIIKYYVPTSAKDAKMVITNHQGRIIKTADLPNAGLGQLFIKAGELSPGTYAYTLYVNDRIVATKQMILVR